MTLPPNFFTPDYMFCRLSKKSLRIAEITAADINLNDIAHRLALLNRWRGDTMHPWSVASHSVLVARLAAEAGETREVQAACLMHDAHEAWLCDLPRDVKRMLPEYVAACNRLQAVIDFKYGVSSVHHLKYDNAAAEIEFKELVYHEAPERCTPVTWWTAEQDFLSLAGKLGVRD